jgi:hypothetical protein
LPDRLRQGTRLTERRDSRSIAGSGLANTRHGDALRRRQDIPFADHALISSRLMSYTLSGVCVHLRPSAVPFPLFRGPGSEGGGRPGGTEQTSAPPTACPRARAGRPSCAERPHARSRSPGGSRPETAVTLYQPNRKRLSLCRAFHDGRRDENKQLAAHLRP